MQVSLIVKKHAFCNIEENWLHTSSWFKHNETSNTKSGVNEAKSSWSLTVCVSAVYWCDYDIVGVIIGVSRLKGVFSHRHTLITSDQISFLFPEVCGMISNISKLEKENSTAFCSPQVRNITRLTFHVVRRAFSHFTSTDSGFWPRSHSFLIPISSTQGMQHLWVKLCWKQKFV